MGNMDMNEIDHFMPMLQKREEDAEMAPMLSHGASHFLWIKHSNLYRIRSLALALLAPPTALSDDSSGLGFAWSATDSQRWTDHIPPLCHRSLL